MWKSKAKKRRLSDCGRTKIAVIYLVATIVTAPSASPVAMPSAVTDAIEGSELLQITDEVMSFPRLSMAVN